LSTNGKFIGSDTNFQSAANNNLYMLQFVRLSVIPANFYKLMLLLVLKWINVIHPSISTP